MTEPDKRNDVNDKNDVNAGNGRGDRNGRGDPGGRTGGPLVEARALRKAYRAKGDRGEFTAVDGIDFEVRRGEAFGLLGANGAGKSSTMRMIACVSPASGGSLRVLGRDTATDGPHIRSRLGVVPQDDSVDSELTVRENLLIYGRYFGLPRKVIRERAAELLEFARLTEKADERVEALSGGMRRRLTIARALINEPEIVLLDEPTTGLDPQARHLLWERLFQLKQNGVTLILTTHYMDEAEQLCDRLVVMDGGRIVAEGSPAALIERYVTREVLELRFERGEHRVQVDKARELVDRAEELPDRLLLHTDDGEATLAAVHARGITPVTALVRRASLEDVFLTLTGRSLVD
ncbi:ABC transporter ATP-binding protein [Streptomyces sp. NPDC088261]|uniref:ABC transporter ATP-binding protein n=1 Tax=Streptomyces sp. NPDC088261 TaxID=3365851 RepID=UPI00382E8A05